MTDWNDDDAAVLRSLEDTTNRLAAHGLSQGNLTLPVGTVLQAISAMRRLRDEVRSPGPSARERQIEALAREIFVRVSAGLIERDLVALDNGEEVPDTNFPYPAQEARAAAAAFYEKKEPRT